MECRSIELPPVGTNAYLLLDPESKDAVIFDAPMGAWNEIETVINSEGYQVKALYLTHGHWDHMLDAGKFNSNSIPIFGHKDDEVLIENPSSMSAFSMPGLEFNPAKIDTYLVDGQIIDILGKKVEIRHVPGHSRGSILFYFEEDKFAIIGDVVFSGSVGRTDLPGADFATLEASIKNQVYTLPDETVLLPGHGSETSVEREAKTNPFVLRD